MGCGSSKSVSAAQLQGDPKEQLELGGSHSSLAQQRVAQKDANANIGPVAVDGRSTSAAAPVIGTAQQVTQPPGGTASRGQAAQLTQVKGILQKLSHIENDGSLTSLQQAADVLLQQLEFVDMVSLWVCSSTSDVCVAVGAAGVGSDTVRKQLVYTDTSHSAAVCSRQSSGSPYLYATITSKDNLKTLPPDWLQLHQTSSLKSFLAAAVKGVDGVGGVVTLASKQASAFRDAWLEPLLSMVGSGLAPFFGHPVTSGLCRMADRILSQDCQDYQTVAWLFIQAISEVLEAVTRVRYDVRLGLLSADQKSTLVLYLSDKHPDRSIHKSYSSTDTSVSLAAGRFPANETLLLEAVTAQGTRLILDTQPYAEGLREPLADVTLKNQHLSSSLVVIPLQSCQGSESSSAAAIAPSLVTAGLYIASSDATDFSACKPAIKSVASVAGWLLTPHLQEGGSFAMAFKKLPTPLASSSAGDSTSPVESMDASSSSAAAVGNPPLSRTMSEIIQMLQQQVRSSLEKGKRHSATGGAVQYIEDLQLQGVLGAGGFGTVYRGTWKGSPAAIKVMTVPKQQRQIMKSAMEMAVLESLRHPNIVCTYGTFTDLVSEYVSDTGEVSSASDYMMLHKQELRNIKFRRFGGVLEEDPDQHTCNVVVLELCDLGSLHNAIHEGRLHQRTPDGKMRLNMNRLLLILLDVARSLDYIHSCSLIHCDLKPANVLLKSEPNSPLGYCCKLADFGLVKWMSEGRMYLKNKSLSGTVTHVAPERFKTGTKITGAVDIYAFGMIMYEAYTRKQPFQGLRPAQMITSAASGQRPVYGPGVPDEYRLLTETCWAQSPDNRPSAGVLVTKLQAMMTKFSQAPSGNAQINR